MAMPSGESLRQSSSANCSPPPSMKVFRPRMQEQMDVRIDEAGHERGVAQLDSLRARGMRDARPGRHYAVSLNQNLPGRIDPARADIENARRPQNDRALRRLRVQRPRQAEAGKEDEKQARVAQHRGRNGSRW